MIRARPESAWEVFAQSLRGIGLVVLFIGSLLYLPVIGLYLALRWALGDSFWIISFFNNFFYYLLPPVVLLLPLALILRRWRIAALLIPVAIVAGVHIVPHFLPNLHSAPANSPQIKVITFNIYESNEHLPVALEWLNNEAADLVFVQEIALTELQDGQISALLDRYPYQYSFAAETPTENRVTNLMLSRSPLSNAQNFPLDAQAPYNTLQRYELDFSGQRIALYNAHFSMPLRPENNQRMAQLPRVPLISPYLVSYAMNYDNAVRDQQVGQLLAQLEQEPLPYIVAGNFNISDQSPSYGQLQARMHDAYLQAGRGFGFTWPLGVFGSSFSARPLLRVDYIWHSEAFVALDAAMGSPWLGSDHMPVIALLAYISR